MRHWVVRLHFQHLEKFPFRFRLLVGEPKHHTQVSAGRNESRIESQRHSVEPVCVGELLQLSVSDANLVAKRRVSRLVPMRLQQYWQSLSGFSFTNQGLGALKGSGLLSVARSPKRQEQSDSGTEEGRIHEDRQRETNRPLGGVASAASDGRG